MEWDLSLIFNNDSEIDQLVSELDPLVEGLETYRDKITSFDIAQLQAFLEEYENFQLKSARLSQYPSLRVSANAKDEEAVALQAKINRVRTKWSTRLAFITLQLGELLHQNQDFLSKDSLATRQYYLYRVMQTYNYRLSEAEEVTIMEKDQYGIRQWSDLQNDLVSRTTFDLEIYGEVQKHSWSSGYGLRSHPDHHTRKAAVVGLGRGLQRQEEIYAYALRNVVSDHTTMSTKRGYDNYMASSLFTSHLNKTIIDTMFSVLTDNVGLFQDYLGLKAKILGTETLRGEDFEAPYPFSIDREIDWEEAQKIVIEGFSEFHPEFGEIAQGMFANNRVDALPRDGKAAGAFCSTQYEAKSSFILLSYNNNMESLGTLAHEMGHAVHAHYITRNQPLFHSSMGMPLAETASEFGSLLFNLKFMREAETEDDKKAVLFNMVDNFMTTIFEVGSRTLFETALYDAVDNGEFLNASKITEIYWQARAKVFGDAIDWLPEQAYHWCWKPHYYIPGFRYYNYPYVFGDFSVLGMYAQYRKDPDTFVTNYREFLKAGGSRQPSEMFAELFNFDLESRAFWEAGIEELRSFVTQCQDYIG